MLYKSKSQGSINHDNVQIFSEIVQMKLKPKNITGSTILKQRSILNPQSISLYDSTSMVLKSEDQNADDYTKKIKFITNLSVEHFLIGN